MARLDLRNARPHERNYRQISRQPPGPHLAPHTWPSPCGWMDGWMYVAWGFCSSPDCRGRSSCTVDAIYLTFVEPTRGCICHICMYVSAHWDPRPSGSSNRGTPTEVKVKSANVDDSIFRSLCCLAFCL